jgi:hypothetical protein
MVEAQEIIQKDDFESHMQFFYESEEGKELSHSKDITYLHCNKGKFVLPACEGVAHIHNDQGKAGKDF